MDICTKHTLTKQKKVYFFLDRKKTKLMFIFLTFEALSWRRSSIRGRTKWSGSPRRRSGPARGTQCNRRTAPPTETRARKMLTGNITKF